MAIRTDTLDLGALRLTSGEGSHMTLGLAIEPLELGGHAYTVSPPPVTAEIEATETPREQAAATGSAGDLVEATLDISRMTGNGYALRLFFQAALNGPCMRCLEPANPQFSVNIREVSQPDEDDEELQSPYVVESILDVSAWAHDALVLMLPAALLCRPDCLGLCPVCGENLNTAGPEHAHEAEPDPRWAPLSELTFDAPAAGADTGVDVGTDVPAGDG